MKDNFSIEIDLADKEFKKLVTSEIRINTELKNNVFTFKTTIPKYLFEYIRDNGDKKYDTIKHKYNIYENNHPRFKQILIASTLSDLISQLDKISQNAISKKDMETAQSEKFIAIKFNHSDTNQRDSYNFSYMGKKFNMNFQFFITYKSYYRTFGEDRVKWKTDKSYSDVVGGDENYSVSKSNRHKNWYYFRHEVDLSKNFDIIVWSQEAEDFLINIQSKFNDIAVNLDDFLSNIDDSKMKLLIDNGIKLLK